MLVRKVNAIEEETKWAASLYQQHNQSIHVTDGVTSDITFCWPPTEGKVQPQIVYAKSR
jgi:hypothetical protein